MIKETAQLMLIAITFAFGSDFRVPADGTGPVLMYTPNQHCMPHVDGGGTVPLCTPDQHCVPQVDGTNPVPFVHSRPALPRGSRWRSGSWRTCNDIASLSKLH